jgi:RNA polymerase sigma-70 factor, ECF subfamily
MFNIAFRMIGDYEETCEVVQDTFLSAYRSLSKFRGDARFFTWLCRICLNHCKDRLKDLRSRAHYEAFSIDGQEDDDPVSVTAISSADPPALEQLETKELQGRVQYCINALDPQLREIIVLRDLQELSYEEMADVLKLPEGTIKSRLFRAREALGRIMQRVFGDHL